MAAAFLLDPVEAYVVIFVVTILGSGPLLQLIANVSPKPLTSPSQIVILGKQRTWLQYIDFR